MTTRSSRDTALPARRSDSLRFGAICAIFPATSVNSESRSSGSIALGFAFALVKITLSAPSEISFSIPLISLSWPQPKIRMSESYGMCAPSALMSALIEAALCAPSTRTRGSSRTCSMRPASSVFARPSTRCSSGRLKPQPFSLSMIESARPQFSDCCSPLSGTAKCSNFDVVEAIHTRECGA